jgi:succinate-acetate transporter protein
MWEFRTGNTFGATAFSSYGAFWISLGFALLPIFGGKSLADLAGGATAVGVFLLGWTIFTGIMFLGTFRLSGALIGVFGFLFLTFLFLTIGALGGASGMTTLGGWLGLITAVLAWYTALAQVLAATNSAIRLPLFPLT